MKNLLKQFFRKTETGSEDIETMQIPPAPNNRKALSPIVTYIPDHPPIELISYYESYVDYYPYCETATKRWFVHNVQDDWIIIDCGANIGYYTILFSRLAPNGHVYAFEPTATYDMLLENLAHHNVENVTALRLALGMESGMREDLIFRKWGEGPEKDTYPFMTIDRFMDERQIKRLDAVKIDVDSFDYEVLRGAEKTLLEFDPYIMVELNYALAERNQSNMEALEWLAKKGYETTTVFGYENFLLKRKCKRSPSRLGIKIEFDDPDAH